MSYAFIIRPPTLNLLTLASEQRLHAYGIGLRNVSYDVIRTLITRLCHASLKSSRSYKPTTDEAQCEMFVISRLF